MTDERRCPILAPQRRPVCSDPTSIPWSLAERAYEGYARRYPASAASQSLERIVERGGFGLGELDEYIPGWREEIMTL